MIVYLSGAIQAFVMYCVNGTSRSSLLIESTDCMIVFRSSIASVLDNKSHGYARCQVGNVIRLLQVHVAYNDLLAILYNDILLSATWGLSMMCRHSLIITYKA